ncbi:MAG: hypothetical protein KKE97_04240 [Proteobacteria bacterium]|jgi:hypothetical protein|nr:hypothetical protein [Pseudomonadota bacterium]MBU4083772.1 hypothetical protein [Pseudomonadota bacterium]MBU4107334.1 hypothetical protein [Pseudomonadota bacterium]MCG2742980.1 hypothetical protein [Desulfobacteraceae bacterium]
MGHEKGDMMRKSTAVKAITPTILFFVIFGLMAKYGVYAAAVVAIFVTARIIRSKCGG